MLSFSALQSQLGKRSNNYFEGSFEKGPRIVSPFPHFLSEKDCYERYLSVQKPCEIKNYT